MELQLALALSSNQEMVASSILSHNQDCNMIINKKKRSYDKAFDDQEVNSTDHVPQTLPLFVWKPNGDDEKEEELEKHTAHINKEQEDESSTIGWPPINSWRKKLLCHQNSRLGCATNGVRVENRGGGGRRHGGGRGWSNPTTTATTMYVKVKMEGVGIARKVDLSLHHSFQTLTQTLIQMFGKCEENLQAYKLTFQDKEGDWLLAGDIPWETFTRSAKRLKLLRNIHCFLA